MSQEEKTLPKESDQVIELGKVTPVDPGLESAINKEGTTTGLIEDKEVIYELDHRYLSGFSLTYCLCSSIAIGFAFAESNQVNFIMAQKLGFTEEEAVTNMALLQNSRVGGVMIGSLIGSKIIALYGKEKLRNIFYRCIIITMFAVGLKFVPNLYTNLCGGVIHGICLGVMNICFQKVLQDTIPNEVM